MTEDPRIVPQTITGPKAVKVSGVTIKLPEDTQTVTTQNGTLLYALHQGRLHAFVAAGEVEIPSDDLRRALARKMFSGRRAG